MIETGLIIVDEEFTRGFSIPVGESASQQDNAVQLHAVLHQEPGSRHFKTRPPWPIKAVAGTTRIRQGSRRRPTNASQVGLVQFGMIVGLYPTGSGVLRKRFQTFSRPSSSRIQSTLH